MHPCVALPEKTFPSLTTAYSKNPPFLRKPILSRKFAHWWKAGSNMPVPFIMPKFDMDQEKATIISWSKKEGDFVKFEESVLTVETEKVAIDVPAPATGTLAGILYRDGDE